MDDIQYTYGTITSGSWARKTKLPYKQTTRIIQLLLTEMLGARTYSVRPTDSGSCITFYIARRRKDAGHIVACDDHTVYFRGPGFVSADFDAPDGTPAIAMDADVSLPGDDELRRTFARVARAVERAIDETPVAENSRLMPQGDELAQLAEQRLGAAHKKNTPLQFQIAREEIQCQYLYYEKEMSPERIAGILTLDTDKVRRRLGKKK